MVSSSEKLREKRYPDTISLIESVLRADLIVLNVLKDSSVRSYSSPSKSCEASICTLVELFYSSSDTKECYTDPWRMFMASVVPIVNSE